MHWTISPGTGGRVLTHEDFVVEEMPARKFLAKYERNSKGVSAVKGPYFLYKLEKKGLTTKAAIRRVSDAFGITPQDIGFAGLKDKFAVTTQYITLKKEVPDITGNPSLTKLNPCSNMMQVGELNGNLFRITLRNCKKPQNAAKVVAELQSRGMPNYFGPQRFGNNANNHEIGRFLLKENYSEALDLINKNSSAAASSVTEVGRRMLKFFINAYQSYVFNCALDAFIKKNKNAVFSPVRLIGYDTRAGSDFFSKESAKIIEKDGITAKSFMRNDLRIKCVGAPRDLFVKINKINYNVDGYNITLEFALPPGSYATVLISEVTKNERI